jgi:hypothetical protein
MGPSLAAVDAGSVVVAARHLFRAGGIPALLLLSAAAALVSVGEAIEAVAVRTVAVAAGVVGAGSILTSALAATTGSLYGDAALLVGVVTLSAAVSVATVGERIRFGHALLGAVAVAAGAGFVLGPRVEAFGWLDPVGAPLQSFALVFAGTAFLPLGYASGGESPSTWLLGTAVVATPFAVALPAVPVGGLGPFFVGVFLLPWSASVATVGAVLFALGRSARAASRTSGSRPRGDR